MEASVLTKMIVNGYSHMIQPHLYRNIVPVDVINIILLYYVYKYPDTATFNDTKYGQYIKFDDTKTVRKVTNNGYGTCLFGIGIANNYSIKIKVKSMLKGFMFGYVTSIIDINYNDPIGRNKNKYHSLGLYVSLDEDRLELYDKTTGAYGEELNYKYNYVFDEESTFKMEFNFKTDKMTIYHDKEKKGQMIRLNGCKLLIPAFTLFDKNDCIKIVGWTKE